MSFILGIPSKILGLVVGLLEGYIIVYLVFFFIAQPYIKMDILNNSNYVINKKDYEALYYVIKSNIDNGDITAAKHYYNKMPKDSEFYAKAQALF